MSNSCYSGIYMKAFTQYLGQFLQEAGFTSKANTWYFEENEVLKVVNLQRSTNSSMFYVNLCLVPNGMSVEEMPTPQEHKCPIRIRLTRALPDEKEEIEKLLDFENEDSTDSEERAKMIANYILSFMGKITSLNELKQAIQDNSLRGGAITLSAYAYLGISPSNN